MFLLLLPAFGYSDGISSTELGPEGCNGCHVGGQGITTASIAFSDPLQVGQPATITVSVVNPFYAVAGFNLVLGTGDVDPAPGANVLRWSATEVSHETPDSSGAWTWNIDWTPMTPGPASYSLWGMAANGDGLPFLDSMASSNVGSTNVLPAGCDEGNDLSACDALAWAESLHPQIDPSAPLARFRPQTLYDQLEAMNAIGAATCGDAIAWSGTYGQGAFEGTNDVPELLEGSFANGTAQGGAFGDQYSAYGAGRVVGNYGDGVMPGRYIRISGRRGIWVAIEKSCIPEGSNPWGSWVP